MAEQAQSTDENRDGTPALTLADSPLWTDLRKVSPPPPKTESELQAIRERNLAPTRWRPGQSGNPGGRPKKKPITEALERMGETPLPETIRVQAQLPKGANHYDLAARGTFRAAAKGKSEAIKEIANRIEGPVESSAPNVNVNIMNQQFIMNATEEELHQMIEAGYELIHQQPSE